MGRADDVPSEPAAAVISRLVRQFDRPLDFYRELVQNSVDAGSNRVDVSLDYDPSAGRALIRVRDDGEGMDRRLIDDYLLVLFRSTKEGDLTKIGKFGIGVISVFAFEPALARLITGRGGEAWRLEFSDPGHYKRYRLEEPVEGTTVELVKAMGREDYARLVGDSRRSLRYWCRHADARITFQDKADKGPEELVSEPFGLPRGESLRYTEEGTEAVLGFSPEPAPFYGFYNRGLTLKEGRAPLFPGVEFKLRSRFLEHTLTRDDVLADDNYRKALSIVRRLAEEELPKRLFEELGGISAAISKAPGSRDEEGKWAARLPYLRRLSGGLRDLPDLPIFPGVGGRPLTLREVREGAEAAGGLILYQESPDRLSRALERTGARVLVSGPWIAELRALLGPDCRAVRCCDAFLLAEPVPDEALAPGLRLLLADIRAMDAGSRGYRGVLVAEFSGTGRSRERFFVAQEAPGTPCPRFLRAPRARAGRFALLNAGHPFLRDLEKLHASRPGLAAFLAVKTLRLDDGEPTGTVEARRPLPEGAANARGADRCNLEERLEGVLLASALDIDRRRRP